MDLRVGELPEEEVGDAHLAAGPHHQLQRGQSHRPQALLDRLGVDLVRPQRARARILGDLARHGDDLLAAAVAQRQGEDHFGVPRAVAAKLLERIADPRRQAIQLPDGVQPDAVVHDLGALAVEVVAEQVHQAAHLVRRPVPVLGREGVQGEGRQPELARRARHVAHRVGTPPVALQAGETPLLRPAAVPVHDDADVAGERPGGDLGAQVRQLQLVEQLSSVKMKRKSLH